MVTPQRPEEPQRPENVQRPEEGVRNESHGVVNGPLIMAGATGAIHLHLPAFAPAVVPRQLRPESRFTNRLAEMRRLDTAVAGAPTGTPVIVLIGPGGAGKTVLALHWLHSIVDRYPDGQLVAEFAGSPDQLSPSDVLVYLLRSLGVDDRVVPATIRERQSLYRSLTANRRIALLIDNATTAAQVRPLIPHTPNGIVVVTSRTRIAGLSVDFEPVFVDVGLFDDQAACELLLAAAGGLRQAEDSAAADAVSRLCGRLPLALSIAGSRLAARPQLRLTAMVAELADERHRLQALAIPGDLSVRAVFDVTYGELPPTVARLYRLVGQHPGPQFSIDAAAAAAGCSRKEAAEGLADLAERHIVDQVDEDRYRLHDLQQLHARSQADPDERSAAQRRLTVWYLRVTLAADMTLMPGRWRVEPTHPRDTVTVVAFEDAPAATAWLLRETANLVATVDLADRYGDDALVWQLVQSLWSLFFRHRYVDAWIATHRKGVAAAVRCGNRLAESKLCSQLGMAHLLVCAGLERELRSPMAEVTTQDWDEVRRRLRQSYKDADEQFSAAVDAARGCGSVEAEATALESLGLSALYRGQCTEALGLLDQARHLAVTIRDPRRRALVGRHRARALAGLGNFPEAESALDEALQGLRRIGDQYNEARALTDLGEVRLSPDAPGDPVPPLSDALDLMRGEGLLHEQARIAELLATAEEQRGRPDFAQVHLEQALDWYRQLRAPETATVSDRLQRLGSADGAAPEAAP